MPSRPAFRLRARPAATPGIAAVSTAAAEDAGVAPNPEDPDDPLLALDDARRRYRSANERVTVDAERRVLMVARATGAWMLTQGTLLAALTAPFGVLSANGAVLLAAGSLLMAGTESVLWRRLRSMRRAVRSMPDREAGELVYELDRSRAIERWVAGLGGFNPLSQRAGNIRATRALHRAIDAAVAACGDPQTDATARLVLDEVFRGLGTRARSGPLDWRRQRAHFNERYAIACVSRDPHAASSLYREIHAVRDACQRLLLDELVHPSKFLSLRAFIAQSNKLESSPELGSVDGARKVRPRPLRGERSYLKLLLRQAARVQTLAEAEAVVLEHLPVDPTVTGSTTLASAAVGARAVVAETRAMRYRLGDRRVTRAEVIEDARLLAGLIAWTADLPDSVIVEHEARMASLGITAIDLRGETGSPVSRAAGAERMAGIFSAALAQRGAQPEAGRGPAR